MTEAGTTIVYRTVAGEEIDVVRPLWENLNSVKNISRYPTRSKNKHPQDREVAGDA
jgi:hypothetical protein